MITSELTDWDSSMKGASGDRVKILQYLSNTGIMRADIIQLDQHVTLWEIFCLYIALSNISATNTKGEF